MEELKRYLNGLGACNLKEEVDSLESALRMMFTPQGREFCVNTGFPTIEFLREHKEELKAMPGVYIDCGNITIQSPDSNTPNQFISGNSQAILRISKPTILHHVIVAHNASLTLHAGEYAVVTVTVIWECDVNVINDGTAKVTIERRSHG